MENGPVVRSLYDEFKKHKGNAIKGYHAEADGTIYLINEDSSSYFKKAINEIWDKYKKYDGIPLSEMTHREGRLGIKLPNVEIAIYRIVIYWKRNHLFHER